MIYHSNAYTGPSKKKIVIRILIVIAALIAVSAATFAYGNHLKTKAANTTVFGTGAGRSESDQAGVGRTSSPVSDRAKGTKSACVPLAGLRSSDEAREYVDALATKGFTGVTVILVGKDGYLTYTSAAVAEYTKQRAADVKDPAILSAITAQAKKHSMRSTALVYAPADFTSSDVRAKIDSIVVADSASLGFDEAAVMLPVEAQSLDSILAASAVRYLSELVETKSSVALGSVLPFDVYAAPRLSPQVELFASVCDFLAVDLTDKLESESAAEKFVSEKLDAVEGYFTMYDLRAVFDGSEQKIADAQVKALADGGFSNYMFVSATDFVEPKEAENSGDGYDPESGDGGISPYDPGITPVDPTPSGGDQAQYTPPAQDDTAPAQDDTQAPPALDTTPPPADETTPPPVDEPTPPPADDTPPEDPGEGGGD